MVRGVRADESHSDPRTLTFSSADGNTANLGCVDGTAGLCGGAAAVNYVWCTELLPAAQVPSVTATISSAFAFGVVLVAFLAYLILEKPLEKQASADVALLGCVVAILPTVYFALAVRSLPETPAWLVAAGKQQNAADIVAEIARENDSRSYLPVQPYVLVRAGSDLNAATNEPTYTIDLKQSAGASQTAVSLRQGELFRQLLALSFVWFAVTCAYYGLAFQAGSLPGSIYVTASMVSLADIPGNGLYSLLAGRQTAGCGQREMQSSLFFIGAVVLLAIGVHGGTGNDLNDSVNRTADGAGGSALVTSAAVFGKVMMAAAFNGVYVFVVDIFPVEVKGGAMGVCNVSARVGGMLAPLIAELSVRLASTAFGLLALAAAITTLRVLSNGNVGLGQQRQSNRAETAPAIQP